MALYTDLSIVCCHLRMTKPHNNTIFLHLSVLMRPSDGYRQ